ncbi:hypothetical protein N7454_001090 [Penicillium verhagenii]|nr:hypothetical protein N7454_001090 [Penicillium verhagenii]
MKTAFYGASRLTAALMASSGNQSSFEQRFAANYLGPNFKGGPKFLHSRIVFQDGDKYFSAQLPEQIACPEDIPQSVEPLLKEIHTEQIYPPLEDGLSIYHDSEEPSVYVKQPDPLGYNNSEFLSLNLLREARICQILMQNGHRNIARYLGCVVKGGRITGLCFENIWRRLPAQIQAGIDHLNALGLVHNDIHAGNIMIANQEADIFVIIDFDSCVAKGHSFPDEHKRGQISKDMWTAEFENDDLAFGMLQEKLQLEISST